MNLRFALGAMVLLSAACLAAPPPSASPSKAPSGSTSGSSGSSGTDCGTFKIPSKAAYDSCNQKCKADQRDQQSSCTNPDCQAGIGTGTRVCLGQCEEGQKSAKQANCYKE
jgi:hypothetical protein